jgi:hypothetical protein
LRWSAQPDLTQRKQYKSFAVFNSYRDKLELQARGGRCGGGKTWVTGIFSANTTGASCLKSWINDIG